MSITTELKNELSVIKSIINTNSSVEIRDIALRDLKALRVSVHGTVDCNEVETEIDSIIDRVSILPELEQKKLLTDVSRFRKFLDFKVSFTRSRKTNARRKKEETKT